MTYEMSDTDKLAFFAENVKKMGIKILRPDINKSFEYFSVENGNIRYAMSAVKGVGTGVVKAIAEEKPEPRAENKSFRTKEDRRKEAKRVERIREIEKLITQKEELIQDLNNQIYTGKEYERMNDIYKQIEKEQELLEELYNEWEMLSE